MKTTLADQVRLGPAITDVKASLSRKKWRGVVKAAHKQGLTVAGALSDAPDALKERTRSSLVREATKTVNTAYKPQEQETTRQQKRLDAIAEKRRADDAHYREWMTTQTDGLVAQARAADTALNGLNQTLVAGAKQGWQDAKNEALAHATTLAGGGMSDPSQSTALNGGIDAAAATSNTSTDAAAAKASTTAAGNVSSGDFLKAAVLANAAGQRAKIEGETSTSQEKLNEVSAALKSAKTSDLGKAITDLLDKERTKANDNRDYAAVAQKLNVQKEQISLDALKEQHSYGLKKKQLDLDQYKADNLKGYQQASIAVGYDRIKAADGRAAADRAMRQWIAVHKPKGKGKGTSDVAIRDSRKQYRTTQTTLSDLQDLHKTHPGGVYSHGKRKGQAFDFRKTLKDAGYDDVTIDIAEDLRKHKGKLSPAGYIKAQQLGIARFYPRV